MTTEEKLDLLSETLDADGIKEEDVLADQDYWDSMTKLSLIVMFDDEFGKKIKAEDIKKFITVKDILATMEK